MTHLQVSAGRFGKYIKIFKVELSKKIILATNHVRNFN